MKSTLYIVQKIRVKGGDKKNIKPLTRKNAWRVKLEVSQDAPDWIIEKCQEAIHQ